MIKFHKVIRNGKKKEKFSYQNEKAINIDTLYISLFIRACMKKQNKKMLIYVLL